MIKIESLFKKALKQAIKEGFDHHAINRLAGQSERKLILTEAEGEAGKQLYNLFIEKQLYGEIQEQGWLFACKAYPTVGLVPEKLAKERLGLNRHCWHLYKAI